VEERITIWYNFEKTTKLINMVSYTNFISRIHILFNEDDSIIIIIAQVSRRKHKDASRDGSGSSRELEDEAKKIEKEKGPSSSDQRKQDMSYMEDAPAREEGLASVTAANSITNNTISSTSAIANSDPSSPPEDQNLSSMRTSPRNISDDDTATAGRPVHRTLPGSFLSGNND